MRKVFFLSLFISLAFLPASGFCDHHQGGDHDEEIGHSDFGGQKTFEQRRQKKKEAYQKRREQDRQKLKEGELGRGEFLERSQQDRRQKRQKKRKLRREERQQQRQMQR